MRWRSGLIALVTLWSAVAAGSAAAEEPPAHTRLLDLRRDDRRGPVALVLEASSPAASALLRLESSAFPAAPRQADANGAGAGQSATRLIGVSAADANGRTTVTLRGNGRLVARTVEEARDQPPRLFVDLPGVRAGVPLVTPVDSAIVARVRVGLNSLDPLVTRVVLDLKRQAPYTVEQRPNEIVVIVGDVPEIITPTASAAPTPVAPTPVASAQASPPPVVPATLSETGTTPRPGPVAVNAPQGPASDSLELSAAPSELTASDTSMPVLPAASVDVSLLGVPTSSPAQPAMAATVAPAVMSPVVMTATAGAFQAQGGVAPSSPVYSTAGDAPEVSTAGPADERRFTGHPVSLDFQGVDLRAVLRTFSEITGLNIVIDPSVQGSVDVALREVPWDQALDIILRANQLSYGVDGNIVRIAALTKLREEEEERRKLAEARALSGNLQTLTRTLSYAKAPEMVQLLTRSALTQRGTIQVDPRTNTLIIRDLQGGLESAAQLIGSLDLPQPQVEIEARIVQTNRNFLRELGVKWGVNLEAAQRLGNALPFSYPNQVGAVGGTDLSTLNPPSSVIGLVTSSVNGAFNLDLELQAAERTGEVRILSTPRVSTQNNVEAEISQGTQIPVQTIANNTVTVTFKDATLTLRVRPQITSSNTVIMSVQVENASPDYTRSVGGIPPIDTQRANTQVQVNDGATTVIGGIFVSNERETQDRVPGLHSIPLLGWLFKNNNQSDSSQELLIFLTPRIIKG